MTDIQKCPVHDTQMFRHDGALVCAPCVVESEGKLPVAMLPSAFREGIIGALFGFDYWFHDSPLVNQKKEIG